MKAKKFFLIEWANGQETVQANSLIEACRKIKASPLEIATGFLVRVNEFEHPSTPESRKKNKGWGYWDAEMFWKHLKEKKRVAGKSTKE